MIEIDLIILRTPGLGGRLDTHGSVGSAVVLGGGKAGFGTTALDLRLHLWWLGSLDAEGLRSATSIYYASIGHHFLIIASPAVLLVTKLLKCMSAFDGTCIALSDLAYECKFVVFEPVIVHRSVS